MFSKKTTFIFFIFYLLWCNTAISEQIFTPKAKYTQFKNDFITIGSNGRLVVPDDFRRLYTSPVLEIEKYLRSLEPAKTAVLIMVKIVSSADENQPAALKYNEGYTINLASDKVVITGKDYLGALHGLTFLEKLMRENKGKVKKGEIADWPNLKTRALHLVLVEGLIKPADIITNITQARFGYYNVLILNLRHCVKFNTMKRLAHDKAWTINEFLNVVNYARENGLEVIPEVNLLSHQEKFLDDAYPELMYNEVTYDPRKEETYKTIFPMIDEIIDLVNPKAFHIGHDEVKGLDSKTKKKWLGKSEMALPPELFLADILRLYNHLENRGIATWMWGDMLIAPEEFSELSSKHLHGLGGYNKTRDKLPKDIVICDWHYTVDQTIFPSSLIFLNAGHKVLGSTWRDEKTIRNFSRYIASIHGEGMIATTWINALGRDADTFNKIIQVSADVFWNAK
ncbi:MAG: family 20 glycosylhydrolase [Candidatus Brocadiaceae bacterium]